jgi:hypothetical protein
MSQKLALAIKEWVFDRYAGFNNDDSHLWTFTELLQEYEKEHGVVSLQHLLDEGHGGEINDRIWKEFLKDFPDSATQKVA